MRMPVGLVPVIALLLVACGAPAAASEPAAAPHRLVAFPPFDLDQPPVVAVADRQLTLHCLADESWCAQLRRGGEGQPWRLEVHEGSPVNDGEASPRPFEPTDQDRGDPEYAIWPHLFREAGGAVLIGLLTTRRIGFSGGGGMETRLTLVRAEPGATSLAEMLDVPVEASSTVRACFSERDMALRLEECSDLYEFAAGVTLDPTQPGGGERPRVIHSARARTFPGRAFRLTDEEAAAREQRQWARSDLAWASDPECTYDRIYRFDVAAGRYRPDRAPPACDDYLGFDWLGPPPAGRP